MSRLFVTGAGTGIGKTFVTCLLLRRLRAAGHWARALKPVISGFDPADMAASDSGLILSAMDEVADRESVGAISPWRFSAPISPDMAAVREGREIDVGELIAFCRYAAPAETEGTLFVEGVGGAMAPLSDGETVLDWMAGLDWPVLLVCGSYLGALSHALTAAESVRLRGLTLAGLVVSESVDSPVPLEECTATLCRFLDPVPVISLPRLTHPSDDGAEAEDIIAALGMSA